MSCFRELFDRNHFAALLCYVNKEVTLCYQRTRLNIEMPATPCENQVLKKYSIVILVSYFCV